MSRATIVQLVLAIVVCGCRGDGPTHEPAELASLRFEVPAEWKRSDWKQGDLLTAQWVPEGNERKESIAIIRSERSPAVASGGVAVLEQLLAASQRSLRNLRASSTTPVKTGRGLAGARIDVDFIPDGLTESYHRVHVVLAEGDGAVVHVLYTAKNPDSRLEALSMVLDSIRHEEG